MFFKKSKELYDEARKYIPGGVNSPVRALKAVGCNPAFIKSGKKAYLFDEDSNKYIDYVCSWGPLIFGHANKKIIKSVEEALYHGFTYGAPTKVEVELAKLITKCVPSIEKVRLVSSGTEATMTAIRLARAYTKRDKIIKFKGCYHGHADSFLVQMGSGGLTFSIPTSPGVLEDVAKNTLLANYNNKEDVKNIFNTFKDQISAVIVEPVAGNMGIVKPEDGFLNFLAEITRENGSLLIFDEVITGFRLGLAGAQGIYNIKPDITTLGKIIGGGFPLAAFGGKAQIMDLLSPEGPVYQAGTLSGNPIACTAGITTIKMLLEDPPYDKLEKITKYLTEGMKDIFKKYSIDIYISQCSSMFTPFFCSGKVTDLDSAIKSNTQMYSKFFQGLLNKGVYPPASQFEAWFVSTAHSQKDIDATLETIENVAKNF
ncbi:glutamate-1-semialdehyde 2,1-aminomutase [Thermodesulfobium acidiphilum]|uniref:Glutamate-1-semialdehyde 2,1-aminomutase n=1 Tax=Thermodesulfobium acidiphilum TaxID=1794699 RepID=A0A2R4W1P8_THEAF|nr:glutamate-1-semialdehyde 2,1-aminomutase [Thermodesulfobium acidiphilum]AWB10733.1 glutamate-1-semialdehyde 2,1-aminomutase [Thermodesulfobium acidiphilum]